MLTLVHMLNQDKALVKSLLFLMNRVKLSCYRTVKTSDMCLRNFTVLPCFKKPTRWPFFGISFYYNHDLQNVKDIRTTHMKYVPTRFHLQHQLVFHFLKIRFVSTLNCHLLTFYYIYK